MILNCVFELVPTVGEELNPVVWHRVVGSRDHHTEGDVFFRCSQVRHRGGGHHADTPNVHTGGRQPGSEGALNIQGNKFVFHESECTAISSTNKGDATEVELSCSGENQGFSRLAKLRLSPGVLRLEENNVGLRYYRCPAAT